MSEVAGLLFDASLNEDMDRFRWALGKCLLMLGFLVMTSWYFRHCPDTESTNQS